jgi:TPR repeat protein
LRYFWTALSGAINLLMGIMKMNTGLSQFWIGIFMLLALPHFAMADALSDMARAENALKSEDLSEAIKYLRLAAEQNHIPAQVQLGEIMHSTQENEEAVGWFLTAAYQGDAAGAYDLGEMYVVGEGVEKSSEKALYWIKYSAEKNHLPAVEVLASAYRLGDLGLAIDLDQAKIWEDKLPPLRAAAKKIIDDKITAGIAAQRAAYKAAMEKAAEKKTAEKKTSDAAAAKKVDAEDDATAKKATEKTEPVKVK